VYSHLQNAQVAPWLGILGFPEVALWLGILEFRSALNVVQVAIRDESSNACLYIDCHAHRLNLWFTVGLVADS